MAWVTWRQHRAALAGVAALLGALAVYLLVTGLQIHHAYATSCHPASSLACTLNFTGRYAVTMNIVRVFLQAVPALIGAFAGAPVLAREMETGTFRFAWTQGFGRCRWKQQVARVAGIRCRYWRGLGRPAADQPDGGGDEQH